MKGDKGMKTLRLSEGLTYCGVLDPGLSVFDIVMKTQYGTTYNAYIVKGTEKTALIETAKLKFLDEYMRSVTGLVDVPNIDYIVVSHTEPDHAGSIEHLLSLNPNIQIVGTSTAITFLKHIVNRDFQSIPVKDGDTLTLGGKTLMFMPLPNLHWPDTMFTYLAEDKALITCDAFGAHYSHPELLRSTVTDEVKYLDALKYYFDGIIGPFKRPYMTAALKRIKDLDIRLILTGHGPVLDSHVKETIDLYTKWCEPDSPFTNKAVVIPYVSAYGYTRQLAEEIEKGIHAAGDFDGAPARHGDGRSGKSVLREIDLGGRIPFGHAHDGGRGPEAHLGSDQRDAAAGGQGQVRQRVRQLRLERRGRAPHPGAAEAAQAQRRGRGPQNPLQARPRAA